MRGLVVVWLFVMSSCLAGHAVAKPPGIFGGIGGEGPHAAEAISPRQGILPHKARVKVGNRQAAARVKQRYPDNKILSVNLIESNGPPVYRFKVLSTDGVVKFVFVDGTNGELFE